MGMVFYLEEYDWILLSKIGEGKTMSQVSEELFITQPALSYRINKIEKNFGSTLFFRSNKGIKANQQGEYLIAYANRMLDELKLIKEQVLSLGTEIKGKLYIGASNAIAQYVLPNLLGKFLKVFPDVEPHVITGFSPYLIDLLSKEKIHIAFLRENMKWIHYKKLLTEENIYIISKNIVQINELPQLPRIDYKTNQSLKKVIDTWWLNNFKLSPNITTVVDNADVCLEFIKSDLGYGILTELGLSKESSLSRIPLKYPKGNNIQRETWLYGSKYSEHYSPVKSFLHFMQEEQVFKGSYEF